MSRARRIAALIATAFVTDAASTGNPPARAPAEIVAAAPASAWQRVDPANLLVMDMAGGGTVAIELAPGFAPAHVAAIRTLVRAGWFDRNAITRVQDNYVAQWGGGDPRRARPATLPKRLPAEYERALAGLGFRAEPVAARDAYATRVGFADGWPVASDGRLAWLPHCYAVVGVGRDMPPDTGDGSELYAVIGHAPRHLDRNVTTVGRVVAGIELLSARPRGTEALGVYARPDEYGPIARVRLAADIPEAERPAFETMRTDSPDFAAYVAARANRRDAFFVHPAGGADICNLPVPVRAVSR